MADLVDSGLQRRCAEDIALLSYLDTVYSRPERYPRNREPETGLSRCLSFRDEHRLSTTLAFLSGIKDNSERVSAVCVTESSSGLVALVAVNAMNASDSGYLDSVKAGFDTIFSELRSASTTSRDVLLDEIFGAIVLACRQRLLERTRIVQGKKKASLETFLSTFGTGLGHLPRNAQRNQLQSLLKSLIRKLTAYRAHHQPIDPVQPQLSRDSHLEDIVMDFYQLSQTANLKDTVKQAFGQIRPALSESWQTNLLDKTRKIASYRKSAICLLQLARSCLAVCQLTAAKVSLDADSCSWPQRVGNAPSLFEVLRRIANTHRSKWKAERAHSILPQKLDKRPLKFNQILTNIEANAKVHAEIQLVWHLQTRRDAAPPRVIASNKEACHLCKTFISSQTSYFTPGTHGRLYPGWRLPSKRLDTVSHADFAARLEAMAVAKIGEILNGSYTRINGSHESMPLSTPTALSMATTVREDVLNGFGSSSGSETPVPEDVPGELPLPVSEPHSSSQSTPRQQSYRLLPSLSDHLDITEEAEQHDKGQSPTIFEETRKAEVEIGEAAFSIGNELWRCVESGTTERIRLGESLDLLVEYTTSHPATGLRPLRFKARRLSSTESLRYYGENAGVYDVERLGSEEVVCEPQREHLILKRREELYMVDWEAFAVVVEE